MRGLGRLITLPIVLIALALQGLAPAQALAMPSRALRLTIALEQALGLSALASVAVLGQLDPTM